MTLPRQLRPKVNNYQLTVEKGEGFDLNCSLFERLVLGGYRHETLLEQHRMRPEISSLVRDLTYPDLRDAPKTLNRPHLRGLQSDIIFISHTHPEDTMADIADRKDQGTTSSKQNSYEVDMVLKIVRYLGQQGYGTENIVILTPYLGQLHKLVGALRKTNDPVLNDLDSFDLVRAGLLPEATAKLARKPIRIATIGKSMCFIRHLFVPGLSLLCRQLSRRGKRYRYCVSHKKQSQSRYWFHVGPRTAQRSPLTSSAWFDHGRKRRDILQRSKG